jgi:hypothetical protein
MMAVGAALLAGCAVQPTDLRYNITVPYDHQAAKEAMAPGDVIINGTAFMRQRGGGVVTCAGQDVHLFANTEYARQRLTYIYGHAPAANEVVSQDVRIAMSHRYIFNPDVLEYKADQRTTKCDGQGNFTFDSAKDGEYFIVTGVLWEAGAARQGGVLATKIIVSDGKAPRAIMSR